MNSPTSMLTLSKLMQSQVPAGIRPERIRRSGITPLIPTKACGVAIAISSGDLASYRIWLASIHHPSIPPPLSGTLFVEMKSEDEEAIDFVYGLRKNRVKCRADEETEDEQLGKMTG
ncbi:hypothetical protein LXL04_037816 [Taraxacum kok-saghyz]